MTRHRSAETWRRGQSGIALVEYLVLIGFIAVLCMIAVWDYGEHVEAGICNQTSTLDGIDVQATPCAAPEEFSSAVEPPGSLDEDPCVAAAGESSGPSGPAIVGPGPLVVLPFPGTVSVSCTGQPRQNQKEGCKANDQNGVSVDVVGEVSAERSQTRLDGRSGGCPKVDLSVSGKVQVQATGKSTGKEVGGTLSVFAGTSTKYNVSVSPEAAEAMERGERHPPNPLDPRTLVPGESIELSQEFYTGHNLQVTYRKLQIGMGFEEGRRLSSGVRRVDENTVRVYVGDADLVKQALLLGTSVGEFSVAIGGNKQLSQGEVRSVDIDISTPEGWDAYQKFLASGEMPCDGAAGTSNALSISSIDYSGSTTAEVKAGRIKLGGVLNDAEGSVAEIRHADGRVDRVSQARYNDVGVAITENQDGTTYSMFIEGVDKSLIDAYEQFSGKDLAVYGDGNVRLDFTEGDLKAIREQALDQLVQRAKDTRQDISREELERMLREDPRRLENAGMNDSFTNAFEIARAETPEDILRQLYLFGGAGSNGNTAIDNLIKFGNATARARHGDRAIPRDHPDSVLPGTSKPPPGCALE
jgi:hypothetical protein